MISPTITFPHTCLLFVPPYAGQFVYDNLPSYHMGFVVGLSTYITVVMIAHLTPIYKNLIGPSNCTEDIQVTCYNRCCEVHVDIMVGLIHCTQDIS